MVYIRKELDHMSFGDQVTEMKRQSIADNCETLQQINTRLDQALHRIIYPDAFDQFLSFVSNNGWQIVGFIAVTLIGMYCVRGLGSTFSSSRELDLKRIQSLESNVQALSDKTRDLSIQVSVIEYAANHNQNVTAMQSSSNNVQQAAVSTDVANLSESLVDFM